MKKLRVAVIGCGRISVMHFDAILQSAYAESIACCDTKFDRAQAAAKKYGGKA